MQIIWSSLLQAHCLVLKVISCLTCDYTNPWITNLTGPKEKTSCLSTFKWCEVPVFLQRMLKGWVFSWLGSATSLLWVTIKPYMKTRINKEFLHCFAHECTLNCCRTGAEGFQGGAVVFLHPLVSVLEQQADCRGGSVKLVYLQPLDCLPVSPCQRDKSNRNRTLTWSCSLKTGIAGITLSLRHARCPARLYTEGLILVFDCKQLFIGRDTDMQRTVKQRSCALTKTLAAGKSWRRDN